MKASLSEQKRLLDLQAIDNAIAVLGQRARTLPQDAHIASITRERDAQRIELARHVGEYEDVQAEQRRLEDDTATVEARLARDRARLSAGGSSRDLQAFEAEIESLTARRSTLDDATLVVMERAEHIAAEVERARTVDEGLRDALQRSQDERAAALDEIAEAEAVARGQRQATADAVEPVLLERYAASAARSGIGAALLRQRACGGCSMTLNGADLEQIRTTAVDEVVACPECSCILVRTEESGMW